MKVTIKTLQGNQFSIEVAEDIVVKVRSLSPSVARHGTRLTPFFVGLGSVVGGGTRRISRA